MRMNFKRLLFILPCFLVYPNIWSAPVIRLSMRSLPEPQHLLNSVKKPSKIDQYQFQGIINYAPFQGIFSTYAGFLGFSDYNGQTLFPLKHTSSFVYLLITDSIFPITMFANTVHHWELVPGNPAAMFKCEMKQDKDRSFFWHISSVPIPTDNTIPLEAIIILVHPDYVKVHTGIMTATNNPNLILPDIYIKKGINVIKNANYMINLRHLFGTVGMHYNRQPMRYQMDIHQ